MEVDAGSVIKVAVVGAGIVGLSVASRLKGTLGEKVDITIISDAFLEETTSYGSGGLWEPYEIDGTSFEKLKVWAKYTFEYFKEELESSTDCGIFLLSAYELFENPDEDWNPFWKDIVYNFALLTKDEMSDLKIPSKWSRGYRFETYVADQKIYLKFLTNKLINLGVKFQKLHIDDISQLTSLDYNCCINCSGLGAILTAKDEELYPIRGQVIRVKAPWINSAWSLGSFYIIPNMDTIVLGGTNQKNNWSTDVSAEDTETILKGVGLLFPALVDSPIDSIWVGLRPGRVPLRLDSQVFGKVLVVNCYGHGGSGITLAMGCAEDVVQNHFIPFFL